MKRNRSSQRQIPWRVFFLTANQLLALGFQGLVIAINKIQDFKFRKAERY